MNLHAGQQLGVNTVWLFIARLGTQFLAVLFTIILARRLGEVGLGEYAFIMAVVFVANVVTSFGTDMLIVRELAANKDITLLPAALVLQLALSVACVSIIWFAIPNLPGQSQEAMQALKIFSFALFPLAFYTTFSAALRGYEQMDLYMWLNLISAGVQFGLLWFIIKPGSSIVTLAWLLLGVQVVAAKLAGIFCLARIPGLQQVWHIQIDGIARLARASAPIATLGLLGMVYQKLSIYILATLDGAATTGWFSAAMRAVEASKLGHVALFGALYPVMSQARSAPVELAQRWRPIFSFTWKALLLLSGVTALALFMLAPVLVPLLYGAGFDPSIAALRVLGWTLIPYTISTYLTLDDLAAGKEQKVGVALSGSLVILALLTIAWVGPYSLVGACWAALLAECTQASILLLLRIKP